MILLLSGAAGVGKSSLALELIERHEFRTLKSSSYLKTIAVDRSIPITRLNLQELGDQFDIDTDFRWLVDQVAVPQILEFANHDHWLLDSVRKPKQVEHFRNRFHGKIVHAHLEASEDELRFRAAARARKAGASEYESSYEELIRHPNEKSARGMSSIADILVPCDAISIGDVASQLLSRVSDL